MDNLEKAKQQLKIGYTCVLAGSASVIASKKTGIAPMLEIISQNKDVCGFSAADKIVGKAVAMLMAKAKIREVYAEVLSKSAIKVFEENGIAYSYQTLTDKIINRAGTDICPMEKAVENIEDLNEAYIALSNKFQQLNEEKEKIA